MDQTQAYVFRWVRRVSILVALLPILVAALVVERGTVWAQASDTAVVVPDNITADQVNDIARERVVPLMQRREARRV